MRDSKTTTHYLLLAALLGACAAGCDVNSSSLPTKFGRVAIAAGPEGVAVPAPGALFYKYLSSNTGICDTTIDDGTCRVWACDASVYTSLPGISVLDAGAVSVSGTKQPLSFTRSEDGSYGVSDYDGAALWEGGETLVATITGSSDYPSLTTSLVAPHPFTITAPEVPEAGLSIDPKTDFSLTWRTTGNDYVYVSISAETPSATGDQSIIATPGIDCSFRAAGGSGTIKSALLQKLPRPANLSGYELDVLTLGYQDYSDGDASTEFRASWVGLAAHPKIE